MEKTTWKITSNDWGYIEEKHLFTYNEEEKQENEINRENAKKYCKYLTIPRSIFELWLSWNEAILYAFMSSWIWDWTRFYFTNNQLSKLFNISIDTITRITKSLSKKWLVELGYKRKSNWWQIRFINIKSPLLKIRSSKSAKYGGSINNINNKKEIYKEKIKQDEIEWIENLDNYEKWLLLRLYKDFDYSLNMDDTETYSEWFKRTLWYLYTQAWIFDIQAFRLLYTEWRMYYVDKWKEIKNPRSSFNNWVKNSLSYNK